MTDGSLWVYVVCDDDYDNDDDDNIEHCQKQTNSTKESKKFKIFNKRLTFWMKYA